MALGTIDQDTKRKVYLSISHGKVVHYLNGGGSETFKNVEGTIVDITIRDRSFNGKTSPFWYLDLRDKGEFYSLSLPYSSGTFKSIILSLASYRTLTKETRIVIEPYERNGYTKVCVYADGEKLDWIVKELPPLREVVVGGTHVSDDTERMEFIRGIANDIRERIGKGKL